jgi:hypothetical protein
MQMDYEATKRSYFMGHEPITLDMLENFDKQYQNVLLRIEDDKFFEPYETKGFYHDELQVLGNELQSLGIETPNDNQTVLLIRPSFEPDHALVIEEKSDYYDLTFKIFDDKPMGQKETCAIPLKIYHSRLNHQTGLMLEGLIDTTIKEARPAKSYFYTLDGTEYILMKMVENELKRVFKNPREDSKTGEIAAIFDDLIKNILNDAVANNETLLQKRIETVINLD